MTVAVAHRALFAAARQPSVCACHVVFDWHCRLRSPMYISLAHQTCVAKTGREQTRAPQLALSINAARGVPVGGHGAVRALTSARATGDQARRL